MSGALEGQAGEPIDTLVFGLSTVPEMPEEAHAFAQAVAAQVPVQRIIVTDDAVAHHAALFGSAPGIALAIGTGVACTAVGTDQGFYSVSGYGFLLGDDGGAFWLGREAIRVVLDGRYHNPQTPLALLVGTEFGDLGSLPALIHSRDRAVNDVAHLAPQILALAHTDPQAQSVVEAALQCLARSSVPCTAVGAGARQRLGCSGHPSFSPPTPCGPPGFPPHSSRPHQAARWSALTPCP